MDDLATTSDLAPRRARSMAEMGALFATLFERDAIRATIEGFRPRPTDVIISPFAKCGTTWLQQTFHCLRTRGDMDFDDISRVVPWIETASVIGFDLQAAQRGEPRGFKSHLPYDQLPRGGRAVVSLRDPKDALVSMYRFMEGWFLEPGAVTIEEFAVTWLHPREDGSDYWHHLVTWWEQRRNPDVLLFSYPGMSQDPAGHIRRLAEFCGLQLDDELLALTLRHSSISFMLEHKDRFDDAMMRRMSEARCNLPSGSDSAKVRKGGSGGHTQELPAQLSAKLDAMWTERVTPKIGLADFAAVEAALRAGA